MKTVLISGCSSGFGALSAQEFARAGAQVIATMRNPAKGEILGNFVKHNGLAIDIRQLDVTDPSSIKSCISAVLADYGKIDVLINNAGIHLLGAIEDMDEADLQAVMNTNFLGVMALTRAVLPAMRQAGRGSVITVSSVGSRIGRASDGIYCASKAAVEMAMEALKYEVARFGINVSVVCPGAYKTNIGEALRVPEIYTAGSPYADLILFRAGKVRAACANGGDPQDVARLIRAIADDPAPAFRYVAGEMAIRLDCSLRGLEDGERVAAIARLAGIEWWVSGEKKPDTL